MKTAVLITFAVLSATTVHSADNPPVWNNAGNWKTLETPDTSKSPDRRPSVALKGFYAAPKGEAFDMSEMTLLANARLPVTNSLSLSLDVGQKSIGYQYPSAPDIKLSGIAAGGELRYYFGE
jgi:hypothetical protein